MATKNHSGNGGEMAGGAYAEDDVSRKRLRKEQGVGLNTLRDISYFSSLWLSLNLCVENGD